MSEQSIIFCTEKCNDVINSLRFFMDGSKSIPTAYKDIHLSLKNLKKVTTDVGGEEYNQLTKYEKILRKRKRVQEEENFNPKNTQYRNSPLTKSRLKCESFLESEDSKIRKTTSNKNRKICT